MCSPLTGGLFARAIMESGSCADPLYFTEAVAETQGRALATALGCAADDLACLRAPSTDAVLTAVRDRHGRQVDRV